MTTYEFIKTSLLLLAFAYSAPFLLEGIKTNYLPLLEPRTLIGIITMKSSITDSSPYLQQLYSLFKNPSIKGIIIEMDSSNAAAGTSHVLFYEIQALKKQYPKPIITLVENECLFGAYLIASAGDYIIAPESALIGGIGTHVLPERLQTLCNNCNTVHNELYQHWTKLISITKKLSLATVSNWADEKIFTGKQALAIGLINEIGSIDKAIALLKDKALIEGEIEWVTQTQPHLSPSMSLLATMVQ